jgi:transcriptional regulator with XRE-family HTH domain
MARTKSISKFIRDKRQENGLTQYDFAQKLATSQSNVANWESGKSKPTNIQLKKIEKLFGKFNSNDTLQESSLIGSWLRTERTKQNLTIQELSDKAKVLYPTIWQIENNKISTPRKQTLERLEKALKQNFNILNKVEPTDKLFKGLGVFQEFNPYDKSDIPDDPGVYVLYDISERPIYVGQGQKISLRIKNHEEKFWFKQPIVQTAAYVKIADKNLRESIETVLIKFLKSNAVINKQNVERDNE